MAKHTSSTMDPPASPCSRASAARAAYEAAPPPLAIGDTVRHNVQRGKVGRVVLAADAEGLIGVDFSSMERVAPDSVHATEVCGECGRPRAVRHPCAVGHWAALRDCDAAELGARLVTQRGSREDRVVGVLLVGACADALGAPFEGWGSLKVRHHMDHQVPVRRMVPGSHMGLREAGLRVAMYTDDTMCALALADALADGLQVDAQRIAHSYAHHWATSQPARGMPDSAKRVLEQVRSGDSIRTTGVRSFPMGSFANGAAMRIAPLACMLAPSVPDAALWGVVAECCVSSHVHPDAVAAAVVQCRACMHVMALESSKFDAPAFWEALIAACGANEPCAVRLRALAASTAAKHEQTDQEALEQAGVDVGFQLYAPDAVATVAWFFTRYHAEGPEAVVARTVSFGGDCDTTGAMVGALVGAHWGTHWIPAARWYGLLENGPRGRDYIVALGRRLAAQPPLEGAGGWTTAPEYEARPLCQLLARAASLICAHFGWPADTNVVEKSAPHHWDTEQGAALWAALWDALASPDGKLRGDIASALLSLVCEVFVAADEPVAREEWITLLHSATKKV